MQHNSAVPSVAVIVLTSGGRDTELAEMAASLAGQVVHERVLVANGVEVEPIPGWSIVSSPTNLGVPGGRSFGIQHSTSDVLVFLDDDSTARSADLAARTQDLFKNNPALGALAYRVVVSGSERSLRRWKPAHLRPSGNEPCDAVTFPGNGHALRRQAFDGVGGYTNEFFFKHEETELSWKLLDAGWNVQYCPDLVVQHPDTPEGRNPTAVHYAVRNKVWLARGLLPKGIRGLAIVIATLRVLVRARSSSDVRQIRAGLAVGFTKSPIDAKPIAWATVRELARRGRPPLF